MFLNSSSSAVRQSFKRRRVRWNDTTTCTATNECINTMTSAAVVNPHHALDANCSLAMTTEWKTVCSAVSSIPWLRKTESMQCLCARTYCCVYVFCDGQTACYCDAKVPNWRHTFDSAFLIAASMLLLFTASTIMYESSANLSTSLPAVMAFRSAALTTYEAGPICWILEWR